MFSGLVTAGVQWPTKPPRGYLSARKGGKRTIEFTDEAPLIRQAFEWKAEGLGERHPDYALSLSNLAYKLNE